MPSAQIETMGPTGLDDTLLIKDKGLAIYMQFISSQCMWCTHHTSRCLTQWPPTQKKLRIIIQLHGEGPL